MILSNFSNIIGSGGGFGSSNRFGGRSDGWRRFRGFVVALIAIKNDLNDPYSVLENWDINSLDPCSWRMITCFPDGHVSALLLQNNAIFGPIPANMGKLQKLQILDLSNNKFSGGIPSSLGSLNNLNYLRLNNNNLFEPFPKSLANIEGFYLEDFFDHSRVEVGSYCAYDTCGCVNPSLADQFDPEVCLGHLKWYSFKELRAATDHFNEKNILGIGGFKKVYKGVLQDGTLMAVKKLIDYNTAGEVQFQTECDPKIIHRDVKVVNILLDEDYEAIVGDFGLAKLLYHRDSNVSTAVHGTVGHIAPEYLSTGQSSEKTDVFSFGILLLELITGQKALDFERAANQKGVLHDWVKKLHQDGKLHLMVDKDLKNNLDLVELEEMVQVALLCTQFHPLHSPIMSEVMRMLEGDGLAEKWEASQKIEIPKY
ncbi:hypothetical protein GIB67_019219 [Kingdonia uniflora]|uniref:non-specific serine/threonine protein kinase n=1 Tax=Kingdonia uniflora TaxID=39325 RepID=A0A7J7N0A3_9MAGN|nr:hypothetical protein GIB67_019219 [Kingdonia uniflora]